MSEYVQYGCGLCAPPTWRNFDASPTLWLQRLPIVGPFVPGPRFPENAEYADIVRGLPVPDGSCAAVYCSHVLEHLTLADFRIALCNTFRLLRPGGVFRLVTPDLEYLVRNYVGSADAGAAVRLLEDTALGRVKRSRSPAGVLRELFGHSFHLWLWDFRGTTLELASAGFVDIRRATVHDAADPRFIDVEQPDRWENCLGVECRRPS